MKTWMIAATAIVFVLAATLFFLWKLKKAKVVEEAPSRKAGRLGEEVATNIIQSVLREDDHLYTNVKLTFRDEATEMDNIVVNQNGVFVFEVKNYIGKLYGNENDFEWNKYKVTENGNVYKKAVRNPIKQVKRQIHILSKYLKYYGCKAWVEGKVILVQGNSPVRSTYIITGKNGIDRLIHTGRRNRLDKKTVTAICCLLSS